MYGLAVRSATATWVSGPRGRFLPWPFLLYAQAVQPLPLPIPPVPSPILSIQEHVPLAPYTTLGIGGPARFFVRVTTPEQIVEAAGFARARKIPLFILGGGSNLLVSDAGFDGLVIQTALSGPVRVDGCQELLGPATSMMYTAPAGMDWDAFVLMVAEAGVTGVECLAGIPGLVGGSPIQNIGAYGQEVADTIASVTAFDLETLDFVSLDHGACGFGYRRSIFNTTHRNRYIVTAVVFRFDLRAAPKLLYAELRRHFEGKAIPARPIDIYHAVREIRRGKGMLLVDGDPDCRSAGSFFKNPIVVRSTLTHLAETLQMEQAEIPQWPASESFVKISAAWLLEQAGFHKGFAMGSAGISSRHTLALINRGGASFGEIAALRDRIIREVKSRFRITLEQEPVQVG